ncbi:gammaproteobacterial enzyme C- transmembrane domain protein [Vibrio parahaemolyticus AN-5034]|nr:gammaproteobacterial enzyme C- transmembrane domain protein [Vibrio parahaemolyticus AN-5034]
MTPISTGQEVDGVSYREEVPFALDSGFYYVQEYDDFERYCFNERRYSTCESWASVHWTPWNNEAFNRDFTSNALAYVEGNTTNTIDSAAYTNKYNNVINSLTAEGKPVGNQSVISTTDPTVLETRNTVVAPGTSPNFDTSDAVPKLIESRAWKTNGTFTVGSVSRFANNDNGDHSTSKAAIWDSTGSAFELNWPSGQAQEDERLAQGSMRDLVVKGSTVYGVGYNTYDSDNNYMNATVFVGTLAKEGSVVDSTWVNKEVDGAQQRISGDTVHTNSRLTDVNANFVAIGEAKRSGAYLMPTGSAPNRLFVVDDVTKSSVSAFYPTSGIFFSGAGGQMGGINSYNEIVGQLDAEKTREEEGKPRRKRGFIYPYAQGGTVSERAKEIFDGKAWFLDDLTNGANDQSASARDISDSNNEFRIINASDINDAGVISATAMKCAGGYDTTAHNSFCSSGEEKIVAVKLKPIPGATKANIQPRSVEEAAAERQGAGLGWLALTMLGLFGFRRK